MLGVETCTVSNQLVNKKGHNKGRGKKQDTLGTWLIMGGVLENCG